MSDPRLVLALRTQRDDGEAEPIALAMELRDVAVLRRAKRRGVVPRIGPLLTALDDAGGEAQRLAPESSVKVRRRPLTGMKHPIY